MSLFETLPYRVLEKHQNIELRIYPDFILAETKTPMNDKMDTGFMPVFNYISGDNESKTKISMTTPVVTQKTADTLITGFYVPKKFKETQIPKPSSKAVHIETYPEQLFLVIRFRGSWKKVHFDRVDRVLQKFIQDNHFTIQSNQFIFRYQPPFIPGIFRRNEIGYVVKKDLE